MNLRARDNIQSDSCSTFSQLYLEDNASRRLKVISSSSGQRLNCLFLSGLECEMPDGFYLTRVPVLSFFLSHSMSNQKQSRLSLQHILRFSSKLVYIYRFIYIFPFIFSV